MIWDPSEYWNKACLYARRSLEDGRSEWERAFWSALALELLARAALTSIHPVLNADPQSELNLFYALGYEVKGQPRSIPVHAVLARLERLIEDFDKPTRDFCDFFVIIRNRELHTTELAFEGLAESQWLPRYYKAANMLCAFIGHSLEEFVGAEAASTASQLIEALDSDKRSEVMKRIAAHRAVFEGRSEPEREEAAAEQAILSQAWPGAVTAVACPACGSTAKLSGDLERESEPMFEDGRLFVEETYLASRMECGACDLTLKDIQEIHHADLDPHFKRVVETDLHAYFDPEEYEEYNNM